MRIALQPYADLGHHGIPGGLTSIHLEVRRRRVDDAWRRSGADVHGGFGPLNPPTLSHPSPGPQREHHEGDERKHGADGENNDVPEHYCVITGIAGHESPR